MPQDSENPLLVGFVADLIFQSKIELAARTLNFGVTWIERVDMQIVEQEGPRRQLGEPMTGPASTLIEELTLWHPALLIFDLDNAEIPWRRWLPVLKSVAATRRIPLICYGSHVEKDAFTAARDAGAEIVVPRSRFSREMVDLIQEYSRVPNPFELDETCQAALPELAQRGLELFNKGEYFEAHELLEEIWKEDITPGRELYRAVLQIAVAYLQITRRNYNGAIKMFWRSRQWIDPLPDECRGVDVAQLRKDARQVYRTLVDLGRERISEFDLSLLKPVHYVVP